MNIRKLLKWMWRVVRFPFVLVIWLAGGIAMGIVAPFDWLFNPSKWNGFDRKDI